MSLLYYDENIVILYLYPIAFDIVSAAGSCGRFGPFFLQNVLREDFKYYFADFVRKGGIPPPLTDFFFDEKGVTDLGGTPPPYEYIFAQKCLTMVIKWFSFRKCDERG